MKDSLCMDGYVWRDGEERHARSERRVNGDLRCRYEGYKRLCKSRVGLVRHASMRHRRVEGGVRFVCEDFEQEIATKGALVNYRRVGGRAEGVWEVRGSCILH